MQTIGFVFAKLKTIFDAALRDAGAGTKKKDRTVGQEAQPVLATNLL